MPSTNPSLLETLSRKLAQWHPPLPWAVGYSGGRDSGVLLWALSQLAPPESIVALHVDHGWRSEDERLAETKLAAGWCRRLGVTFRHFEAPSEPVTTEAGAREHRYACFQTFTEQYPLSPVFLAHHADDQAETILMRLLKGRSWRGLGGMAERRGPFLRPWLEVRAAALALTAHSENVPWHEDSSNASDQWTRNYLRLTVFPQLAARFPRAVESLNALGDAWRLRAPAQQLDGRWIIEGSSASLAAETWRSWDALERQIQLEAASAALGFDRPPSRRFLEAVSRKSRAEGAGWSWSCDSRRAVWQRVVQISAMEYFVVADADTYYEAGSYRVRWSRQPVAGALRVPADPDKPVVWRTASAGMVFASRDDADWGKDKRRRRLGSLSPDGCVLVQQDGWIRAVINPFRGAISWSEDAEKLNKAWIFVTLEPRSEYERR